MAHHVPTNATPNLVDDMTEQAMRKRLADVTRELDEERAKVEKLIEAIADLMKACAVGGDAPLWQPRPFTITIKDNTR